MKVKTKKQLFSKYKLIKLFVYNTLENERHYLNAIYNVIGLFFVITSSITVIFLLTPQAERIPSDLYSFLKVYEDITLFFFMIEYILRFWVSSDFFKEYKEELINKKVTLKH